MPVSTDGSYEPPTDHEARLRRQVEASRHDPSNSERAMAWAVDEIDALRLTVPHAYGVETLWNQDRPSERWAPAMEMRDERLPLDLVEAEALRGTMIVDGHDPAAVRVVAIAVADTGPHHTATLALQEVLAERTRQISLGYTAEHDDAHAVGDLIDYALGRIDRHGAREDVPRHALVEAAAVLVAAVESRDRRAERGDDGD